MFTLSAIQRLILMMVRFFCNAIGLRGEELPVTLFRIDINGEVADTLGILRTPQALHSVKMETCLFPVAGWTVSTK